MTRPLPSHAAQKCGTPPSPRPTAAVGVTVFLGLALSLCFPHFPMSTAPAAAAATPTSSPPCSPRHAAIHLAQGGVGTGHVAWVIQLTNSGPRACLVTGYPVVQLLDAQGNVVGDAAETPDGYSGGPAPGTPTPRLNLRHGGVAAAVIEGTDVPLGGATSCPSYPSFVVTLPGQRAAQRIDHTIGSCSGLTVHLFVLGFNGLLPTGEVLGHSHRCVPHDEAAASIGPLVQIDAWSGTNLAASVTRFTRRGDAPNYQLVLKPGRFRIHAKGDPSSVHVTVQAGQAVHLGTYGACEQVTTVPTTIPGHPGISGPLATTTTT